MLVYHALYCVSLNDNSLLPIHNIHNTLYCVNINDNSIWSNHDIYHTLFLVSINDYRLLSIHAFQYYFNAGPVLTWCFFLLIYVLHSVKSYHYLMLLCSFWSHCASCLLQTSNALIRCILKLLLGLLVGERWPIIYILNFPKHIFRYI